MADLLMPKLGLTMTEGLLAEWRVAPGESFAAGDVLFVVETEKIANEIDAQAPGAIAEILVAEGETVPVGTPVARLAGAASEAPAAETAAPAPAPAPDTPPPAATTAERGDAGRGAGGGARLRATPLARRLARRKGVDLHTLTGSGPRGRIKASDVERAAASPAPAPESAPESAPAPTPDGGPAGAPLPLDAARAATARRVTAAKRDIPHFYLQAEAEVTRLMALRAELNADARFARVTVSHLLVKALGTALAELPEANRIWLDEAPFALARSDVGLVVDTPAGLRIPVLRAAGAAPLDRLADEAREKTRRARDGTLRPEDVGGGAVSLSNVGMHGVTALVPIVSPPQAMILGVGAERRLFRPDAEERPAARRELVLSLACDHRIIDGALAARFLARVVAALEQPVSLLRAAAPADTAPAGQERT